MPGLSEGMNVAIGVQMLIVAIVSLVVGLILGGNLACSSVAKYLKTDINKFPAHLRIRQVPWKNLEEVK